MYLLKAGEPRHESRECKYPKRVVFSISSTVTNYHSTNIILRRSSAYEPVATINLVPTLAPIPKSLVRVELSI